MKLASNEFHVCFLKTLRWLILCCFSRRGKERIQGPSATEQVAQNATVKVCFASLEKTGEMADQTLQIFAWKKVEKTEIWRAWTVALYNSLWEQRIQQKVCFRSLVPICRLETLLLPPYKVHHQARTTQPKPAHLNPVSTLAQDEWCIIDSFFCWNCCLLIYEETGNSCSGSLMPFCWLCVWVVFRYINQTPQKTSNSKAKHQKLSYLVLHLFVWCSPMMHLFQDYYCSFSPTKPFTPPVCSVN